MRCRASARLPHLATVLTLAALVSPLAPLNAQAPRLTVMDSIRAMRLDSMGDTIAVYFRPLDRQRASALKAMLKEFSEFWSDRYGIGSAIRVAVLRPEDWQRITPFPYGFPHYFVLPANLLPAAAAPSRAGGPDSLLARDGRDVRDWLLIGHEGGHLLTWSMLPGVLKDSAAGHLAWLTVPVAMRGESANLAVGLSPVVRSRFERLAALPQWYWEYAATLFMMRFLTERHPEIAAAYNAYFQGLTPVAPPRFSDLDDWFDELMRARTPEETPYFLTQSGGENFAWYQGVTGQLVAHVLRSGRGDAALSHVRRMVSDKAAPVSSSAIISELEEIAPGARALLKHLGASYGRQH